MLVFFTENGAYHKYTLFGLNGQYRCGYWWM